MATADRLIEVFNEAKAQPPGAGRERLLDLMCHHDSVLKEQVMALLGSDARAGAFLNQTMPAPAAPVTEKLGQSIGRYKLLQKMGEGGCGVVYMAEQNEPVRRRVALKVIKLGMDTKQCDRPLRSRAAGAGADGPSEHRQSARCRRHRNRPALLRHGTGPRDPDHGVLRPEQPPHRRNGSTSSSRSATRSSTPIRKGIIHRDIKPSNILVTLHDGVPVPKVIDFGIAKATEGRLTDKTVFTAVRNNSSARPPT